MPGVRSSSNNSNTSRSGERERADEKDNGRRRRQQQQLRSASKAAQSTRTPNAPIERNKSHAGALPVSQLRLPTCFSAYILRWSKTTPRQNPCHNHAKIFYQHAKTTRQSHPNRSSMAAYEQAWFFLSYGIVSYLGRQGGDAEHLAGPLAVRGRDDGRL